MWIHKIGDNNHNDDITHEFVQKNIKCSLCLKSSIPLGTSSCFYGISTSIETQNC